MLHLYGCPVAPDAASWLVAELYQDGHDDAAAAALTIEHGLECGSYAGALTAEQRRTILSVLVDPPAGLGELRKRLLRDHAQP